MEWLDAIGKSVEYIEEHIADAYDPQRKYRAALK